MPGIVIIHTMNPITIDIENIILRAIRITDSAIINCFVDTFILRSYILKTKPIPN